jgi:superoxide dismutase
MVEEKPSGKLAEAIDKNFGSLKSLLKRLKMLQLRSLEVAGHGLLRMEIASRL